MNSIYNNCLPMFYKYLTDFGLNIVKDTLDLVCKNKSG